MKKWWIPVVVLAVVVIWVCIDAAEIVVMVEVVQ